MPQAAYPKRNWEPAAIKSVGTQIYCCLVAFDSRSAFRISRSIPQKGLPYLLSRLSAVCGLRAWPACQFVCHLGRPSKSVADITVPCTATAAGVEPRTGDRGRGRGHRQCVPGKDKATERTARFTRLGRQPQISEHVAVFGIKHMSKHMKGSRTRLGLALWPSLSRLFLSQALTPTPTPTPTRALALHVSRFNAH